MICPHLCEKDIIFFRTIDINRKLVYYLTIALIQ